MAHNYVNKNSVDVSQVFQTFIAFCGDIERTAVACDLPVETVRDLAGAENWKDKVDEWTKLREGDPRDVQIQINRAVNYVQAHRIRGIIDAVVTHLSGKSATELVELMTRHRSSGEKTSSEFSTRPLTDLVKAAETVQLMTQRALGDTQGERPESSEKGTKGSHIALSVMNAMNAADASGLGSVDLVRQELGQKKLKS